jgi:hypothetical protein
MEPNLKMELKTVEESAHMLMVQSMTEIGLMEKDMVVETTHFQMVSSIEEAGKMIWCTDQVNYSWPMVKLFKQSGNSTTDMEKDSSQKKMERRVQSFTIKIFKLNSLNKTLIAMIRFLLT